MNHTPWTYSRWRGVVDREGNRVLIDGVSLPLGNHRDIEEAEANSRLFSASPELLDACREAAELIDLAGDPRKDAPVLERLRAAIEKATGGKP